MLKLFRRGRGELDPVEQDTRVYVRGAVGRLRAPLEEWNRKEDAILFYLQKHLRYAEAFAREERRAAHAQGSPGRSRRGSSGTPDERVLWLKNRWYRLPLYVRPFLYFVYRYFFLLGILDGRTASSSTSSRRSGSGWSSTCGWRSCAARPRTADDQVRRAPRRSGHLPSTPMPSAAAVADGRFVAGVEEERFRRIKHWAGFPEAGAALLPGRARRRRSTASTPLAVARQPRAYFWRKALLALSHPRSLRRAPPAALRNLPQVPVARGAGGRRLRRRSAAAASPSSTTSRMSPRPSTARRSRRPCASRVDGFGDFVSTMMAVGRGQPHRGARPRPLPALARPLLHGDHPVPRLPRLRRRVQGDGPRGLRRAALRRAAAARVVPARRDGTFRARPALLPPSLAKAST